MLNVKSKLANSSNDLRAEWLRYKDCANITDAPVVETTEQLFCADEDTWPQIAAGFQRQFRIYDKLLRRLHYERAAPFDESQMRKILRFLTIGYVNSNDVRYFNEFLWFDGKCQSRFFPVNQYHFAKCLSASGHHLFPTAEPEEVRAWVSQHTTSTPPGEVGRPAIRVATLGPPPLFWRFCRDIAKDCSVVTQIHFPKSMRGWMRLSFGESPVARLINRFLASTEKCHVIDSAPSDPLVTRELEQLGLDIGVHRLRFIIRQNLIDAFRIGIVNDHWGALPFVRGRSTPEFSLLFGFPLVATMHFVDSGVDTGEIINYYPCSIKRRDRIRKIKRRMSRTKQQRFIDVVRLIGTQLTETKSVATVPNRRSDGLQYFTMHPLLAKYVEQEILSRQTPA